LVEADSESLVQVEELYDPEPLLSELGTLIRKLEREKKLVTVESSP